MAAILDQLKSWFEQPETKPWCKLERSWLFPHSLKAILIAQNISQSKLIIDHSTIQASLFAWSYLKEVTHPSLQFTKVPIPLESLHWLIPNISLGHWLKGKTLYLQDFTKDNNLMPFSEIQNKFNIPASEFLTYSQIASIFRQLYTNNFPIPTRL